MTGNVQRPARHGTGHFIAERVSAIGLLFLTPWFLISIALLDGGFESALAFVRQPLNAIGVGALIVVGFYHARLGLQVIIDDYIAKPGTRAALTGISSFIMLVAMVVGVYAIYLISFEG